VVYDVVPVTFHSLSINDLFIRAPQGREGHLIWIYYWAQPDMFQELLIRGRYRVEVAGN
jgi:hypothetical protein